MAGAARGRSSIDQENVDIKSALRTGGNWIPIKNVNNVDVGRGTASSTQEKVAGMRTQTEETEADPDTLTVSGPFEVGTKGLRVIDDANAVAGETVDVRYFYDGQKIEFKTSAASEKFEIEAGDKATGKLAITGLADIKAKMEEGLFLVVSTSAGVIQDVFEIERFADADEDGDPGTDRGDIFVNVKGTAGEAYAATGVGEIISLEVPKREIIHTARPTAKYSRTAPVGERVQGTANFTLEGGETINYYFFGNKDKPQLTKKVTLESDGSFKVN